MASRSGFSIDFSDRFIISCGTVTLDVPRGMILLIQHRPTGEYYFPKGRKNVGERLEDAATRETFEETGVTVELLPVHIPTRATRTSPEEEDGQGPGAITEPLAVMRRDNEEGLKLIFWYVGTADSTAELQQGTQQEDEDFVTAWMSWDEAETAVTFDNDRELIAKAVEAVKNRI